MELQMMNFTCLTPKKSIKELVSLVFFLPRTLLLLIIIILYIIDIFLFNVFIICYALHDLQSLYYFMKKIVFVVIRQNAHPDMFIEKSFPICPDK